MKSQLLVLAFLFFALSLTPIGSKATVFINEIAWMGTISSSNDEWIELYNNDNQPINLSDWKLTSNGKLSISLTGKIDSNGFYLLERTDDNSVPDITADQIYTGALSNSGETLDLYDNSGKIIDYVACGAGWFSGDNTTKKTMERKSYGSNPSDWATSLNTGGTPKAANNTLSVANKDDATSEKVISDSKNTETEPENPKSTVYKDGIVINELLPAPSGSDAENEFIELYNQSNETINLSDWKLKDSTGQSITYAFPHGTLIPPNGFLLFFRKTTKIILNNDGDEISLMTPDGNVIDKVNYEKAPVGQSYNKFGNEWKWSKVFTPGSKNILSSSIETKDKKIIKSSNNVINSEINLASVSNLISKNVPKKNTPLLIVATLLAITSAIIILLIKRKITKQ